MSETELISSINRKRSTKELLKKIFFSNEHEWELTPFPHSQIVEKFPLKFSEQEW